MKDAKTILNNTIGKDANLVLWVTTGSLEEKLLSLVKSGMEEGIKASAETIYADSTPIKAATDILKLLNKIK